ncbi:hypothetical protein WJX73_004878 [Symbiochloris irregularis]|uniref:SGNH hydrolase-type esterase domain-containing protein n=1 Tax=Symbiochloris irregularis TaxID=706552 RepID=A0AAW1NPI8_9CHLO
MAPSMTTLQWLCLLGTLGLSILCNAANIFEGVRRFYEAFGQSPDAVIFGSFFWDNELIAGLAAGEGEFDIITYLIAWEKDLAAFMNYVEELLPLSTRVLVSTARPKYQEAESSRLHTAHGLLPFNEAPDLSEGTSRIGDPQWSLFHETLQKEVKAYTEHGVELVFYGDSITESWRGTNTGQYWEPFANTPEVFAKHYGSRRTGVFAIAGDTADHLLWRLQHGEGPQGLGLLDIEAAAANVSRAVSAVVHVIQEQAPQAQVLLQGLLPRGDPNVEAPNLQLSKYSAAIEAVNERLKSYAALHKQVAFVDCGHIFLETNKDSGEVKLDRGLMPDMLHPNAQGMNLLAKCLNSHLGLDQSVTMRRLLNL